MAQREVQEKEIIGTVDRSSLRIVQPKKPTNQNAKDIHLRCFEDFYGYRGQDPRVYYLSPWEFAMLWIDENRFRTDDDEIQMKRNTKRVRISHAKSSL